MKAIILAAGRGTRLMPLTESKPKCMIEILHKPIIKWIYDSLIEIGIDDITVISGYREDVLIDYATKHLKGCRFITQDKQTGTADALYLAKDYIDGDFLCLPGDNIFNTDDLMKLRQMRNSLLYAKQFTRLEEFGTLDLKGGMIMNINEKSTEPTSNFINCSAYHFSPEIFDYIPKTEIDPRFNERIITNTINLIIEDKTIFTGISIKERNEISYPEDIKKVEERLTTLTAEEEEIIKKRLKELDYL